MAERTTIMALAIGNPSGGVSDNPWPSGEPAVGMRVAIFAHQVTSVDGAEEDIRSYHVAPADRAAVGPMTPDRATPQGITVRWTGCGTGTVVAPVTEELTGPQCEIKPDDPRLVEQ